MGIDINLRTDVVDINIKETAVIIYACSTPLINASEKLAIIITT